MTKDEDSGVYSNGKPNTPAFLSLKVRADFLLCILTALTINAVGYAAAAWAWFNDAQLLECIFSPEVVVFTFTCTLLEQFYSRGYYHKIARWMGVGETLAFYFSISVILAGFITVLAIRV